MSIQTVPGTDLVYHLVSYDKHGHERADDPAGKMSDTIAAAIHDDAVTDVFLMSHGWQGDIPGAIDQYDRWIQAMAGCAADRQAIRQKRPNFKPLLVGFHWPSRPWGEEEFGSGGSFAAPAATPGAVAVAPSLEALVEQYADRIVDTPRAREAIRTILTGASSAGPGTTSMPPAMAQAYRTLNEEATRNDPPGGDPADDREPFDPDKAYSNARIMAGAVSFGGGGVSGLLQPLRATSFWSMKRLARTLGESCGFGLLDALMKAGPNTRFHLMGHSFGCIVVSSMIHGPNGTGVLPRPIDSLTLVQGATSLWGFSDRIPATGKPGYFRRVIEQNKVAGPILTTQSRKDTAVGKFYPFACGIVHQADFPAGQFPKYGGIGAFGIQGTGLDLSDQMMGDASHPYGFEPRRIYNLEGTGFINQGGGFSGAHSDIAKPEVAHAMWQAVMVA